MDVGEVGELWRYPFKSMAGESTTAAAVSPSGILGDRCWAVRDEELGGIRGARRFPELMRCRARFVREPSDPGDSGDVAITLPSGETVATTDPSAAMALSTALGHRVSVWPRQPASDLDHHRLGQPSQADPRAELREMFALDDDEDRPTFGGYPASCAIKSAHTRRCPARTSMPSHFWC
jgi:MOSC domain-containing protein